MDRNTSFDPGTPGLGGGVVPSAASSAPGLPEGYEQHFGFVESPFTLTSNPRFLYESTAHLAALREIAYALPRREPIIVVTGAIGTGKTTLCRIIAERRGPRTFVATINTAPTSADDLLRLILDGFSILSDNTSRIVHASHYGLLRTLQQFLGSLVPLNAQAIILFDEAQHLSPEMLEQIRLLSNIDVDSRKLLQIILVGQPELEEVLAREDLRQLRQRISRRHHLAPLQPEEVVAYIDRRVSVAREGSTAGMAPEFTPAAMNAITTISGGVPRIINTVCDRALENAWSRQTWTIDAPTIVQAATSIGTHVPRGLRFRASPRWKQAAAAVAVLAGVAGLWWAGSALLGRPGQPARAPEQTATGAVALKTSEAMAAVASETSEATAPVAPNVAAVTGPAAAAPQPNAAPAAPAPSASSSTGPANLPGAVPPAAAASPALSATRGARVTTEPASPDQAIPARPTPRPAVPATPPTTATAPATASDVPASAPPARSTANQADSSPAAPPPTIGTSAPASAAGRPAAPASGSLPTWATRRPAPSRPEASPPLPDDAPIADVLERASALASQPNVRALQQIRNQVAKRHAAATGEDAETLRVALEQVDKHLDAARRRQLEDDARRLGGDPGAGR